MNDVADKKLAQTAGRDRICAFPKRNMSEAWLFRIEFEAILTVLATLLGSILRQRGGVGSLRRNLKAMSAEGAVLLAAAGVTACRYLWLLLDRAATHMLPAIGTAWLAAFGAACAIYLGAKAAKLN
jgi:hypothetical protein